MYQIALDNNKMLLSNYQADFWSEYITHSNNFDRIFKRRYASFTFFDEEDGTDLEKTLAFIEAVKDHLLMHHKQYEELYRTQVIADTEYSLTNNYDMTEEMQRNTSDQGAVTSGQRTDVNNTQIGTQNSDVLNKVSAFNNNNENTVNSGITKNGTRNDIIQFTEGQQTTTNSEAGTESYTLTRKGNIGVMTATDMLEKHKNFWSLWDFYDYIFSNINKELLEVN